MNASAAASPWDEPRVRGLPFSAAEEEELRKGVALHGNGAWAAIIYAGRGIFAAQRTNVDLKDKWRNMVRAGGADSAALSWEASIAEGVSRKVSPALAPLFALLPPAPSPRFPSLPLASPQSPDLP